MRSTRRNADYQTRVWPSLTDPRTGHTLELEPGEVVKGIELPDDFDDPNLVEVKAPKSKPQVKAPKRKPESKETRKDEPVNKTPADAPPATEEKSE